MQLSLEKTELLKRSIYQFYRKSHGRATGVVVASKDENGKVLLGWSLCRHNDKYDRERGLDIALSRMITGNLPVDMIPSDKYEWGDGLDDYMGYTPDIARVPYSLQKLMTEMADRASIYFYKDALKES